MIKREVKERSFESIIKQIFFVCLFVLFLYPFSIYVSGQGVSANYLYLLFPFIVVIVKNIAKHPSNYIIIMIALYAAIFIVSYIYQYNLLEFADRRIISFILFMSIFSYSFIDIDHDMIAAFRYAIVIISIITIVNIAIRYFSLGGNSLGASGKGLVGGQRYGFIYLMAFWIILSYRSRIVVLNIVKWSGIIVITSGLILTFSRSSIVALLSSLMFYFIYSDSHLNSIQQQRYLYMAFFNRLIIMMLGVGMLFLVMDRIFPSIVDFYSRGLLPSVFEIENTASSEGYRVYMLQKILEFVGANPLTGSGFLGVWIMFDDLSGSAHNQYADVLFRTGVLGFVAYIILLFKLGKYFNRNYKDLFYGFIGVLIYGLFHETFKLSQGGFILAFFIGMMVNQNRRKYITTVLKSKSNI